MQTVLGDVPDRVCRQSGFTQRQGKLSGAVFVQTLVFGWWQHRAATLDQVCQTAAALGGPLSPQALDQRFTPGAAALLEERLAVAAAQVLAAAPAAGELLNRFTAVELLDSTTSALPDVLATVWRGCGGRTGRGTQAARKVTVRWDLLGGRLCGPELNHGRTQDRATALQHALLAAGEAQVLLRARWQIEWLFTLWKQHGPLDASRSRAPWRVLCEVYAKLLGLVAQHWALLVGGWAGAERSPVKLVARLRDWGVVLALALPDPAPLVAVLAHLQRSLDRGSRRAKQRQHPATFQLLAAPPSGWA